jgi:hypothetical protein
LISNTVFPALVWPYWALPYVFLAWTAIGVAWYLVIKGTRPEVPRTAAMWTESEMAATVGAPASFVDA